MFSNDNDKDSVSITINKDHLYAGLAMGGCFIAGGVLGAVMVNDLPLHIGSYIRGFEDGFGVKTRTVEVFAKK